jgi:hypothetical protein
MQGDDAIDDEKVQVVVRPGLKEPKIPTGQLEFYTYQKFSRSNLGAGPSTFSLIRSQTYGSAFVGPILTIKCASRSVQTARWASAREQSRQEF